jgi:hypothetical protein
MIFYPLYKINMTTKDSAELKNALASIEKQFGK